MADIAMTALRDHTRDGVAYVKGEESVVPEAAVENLAAQRMANTTAAVAIFQAQYDAARAAAMALSFWGWQGNGPDD